MWQITDIEAEYRRLDRLLGIDTSPLSVTFSSRMVRQYGVCVFQRNRPTAIRIAAFLQSEDAAFWNTVRHEYAHAAAAVITGRRHGHDAVWKSICRRIGADPQRLTASCDAAREAESGHRQYVVTCCQCGAKSVYLRKGAVVQAIKAGQRCTCRKCKGTEFTLREEWNPT